MRVCPPIAYCLHMSGVPPDCRVQVEEHIRLWRDAPEAALRRLPELEACMQEVLDGLEHRVSVLETEPPAPVGTCPPPAGFVVRRRTLRLFWVLLSVVAAVCLAAGYWLARVA